MSNDNTQGDAEPSPASAGSQPVAWAVMVRWEYRDICDSYEEARRRADAITYWDGDDLVTAGVTPLYRNLAALTHEERMVMEWCIFQQWVPQRKAVTLRRLLERLG